MALVTAFLEGSVSNSRLQLMCDAHPYDITKMLHQLAESNYLIVDGYGKGKNYYINNDFLNDEVEIDTTEDEMKIIEYIKQKGFITNQLSRDHLSFGKDKNIDLFNSLQKNNLYVKWGQEIK